MLRVENSLEKNIWSNNLEWYLEFQMQQENQQFEPGLDTAVELIKEIVGQGFQ